MPYHYKKDSNPMRFRPLHGGPIPTGPQYYHHLDGTLEYSRQGKIKVGDYVLKVWNAYEVLATPQTCLRWFRELNSRGINRNYIARIAEINKLQAKIPDWESRVFGPVEYLTAVDRPTRQDPHP